MSTSARRTIAHLYRIEVGEKGTDIMEWIYKYFSFTVFIGGFIGGLGFLIKYLIQRKINSYFDTRLAQYKQELDVMTERSRYDIGRKLFDFEAYATKKHTIYPELYKQVYETWNDMLVFTHKLNSFIVVDKNQHDKIYNLEGLDEGEITEALKLSRKINNTIDYFSMNELFLSKEVSTSCIKTLNSIRNVNSKLKSQFIEYRYNPSLTKVGINEIRHEIDLLKEVIYKELSYSHSEENKEKV